MTEIFRIIGKNDIHFDAGPTGNYLFSQGRPPRKLSTVLTRKEVLALLPRLPLGVRPMALKHGLSVTTMELNILGFADVPAGITADMDMEAKEHALIETLVETEVFFSNGGTMGTKGELQIKSDGASEVSFKSVFYGVVDELDSRDVLGAVIRAHRLQGLRLTLYCEPYWRPGTFNHLFNGGFEFWDGIAYGGAVTDVEPDGWDDYEHVNITGTNNREAVTIQQGTYSLRINVTNSTAGNEYKGVRQNILARLTRGVTYTLVFWLQNATITNGTVVVRAVGEVSGAIVAAVAAVNATFTQYSLQFTPSVNDTTLVIDAYINSSAAGCSGIVYLDGMMVVRGTLVPGAFTEWHPNPGIRIGPNLLSNAGFEEWHAGTVDTDPDCWADIGGGAIVATHNQESIEVLEGCHALEIDVTGSGAINDNETLRQNIFARVTAGVEYIFIVWIRNDVITNGWVQAFIFGDNSGQSFAYNSGAANSQYTRYAVTHTPTVGDTLLVVDVSIRASAAGCIGTAYFDKLMVIEAQVLNGHSFAPEEWTGCGYIWNHLDGVCGGSSCGHVNYLDIDDALRGDVDGRPRIEMETLFSNSYGPGELTVARRTDPCLPCQFGHFLEAEDATTQTRWADHVDNGRSGCDVVSNGAADLDGHVIWDLGTLGYTFACQRGRFRALGAVYADYNGAADENIKFKASVGIAADYQESAWLQPLIADNWHWLDFGVFEVTGQFWGNELPLTLYWRVDYLKEASDLVEFDFLLLLPEDESMLRIPLGEYYLGTNEDVVWDDTFDFTLAMKRNAADAFVWHPAVQAEPLALKPEEQNRLIFAIGHYMSAAFPYKGCRVHDYNDDHMLVSLKYLPQFVSPLE